MSLDHPRSSIAPYPGRRECRPHGWIECLHYPSLGFRHSGSEIVGTTDHWVPANQCSCPSMGVCPQIWEKGGIQKFDRSSLLPPSHRTTTTSHPLLRKLRTTDLDGFDHPITPTSPLHLHKKESKKMSACKSYSFGASIRALAAEVSIRY